MHQHRATIVARDTRTAHRLTTRYHASMAPVQHALDTLAAKLAAWQHDHPGEQGASGPPRTWLYEQGRLHETQLLIARQADSYATEAHELVSSDRAAAAISGARDGLALLEATLPSGAPHWTWGRPSERTLEALGSRAPLAHLFANWGHTASQAAAQTLFADITMGRNPRQIASDLTQRIAGLTYSRAQVIARTSALRAYSDGAMATYRANSDVVEGWIWLCDLGARTCGACLAMNGSQHSLDEDLYDHPNGRCTKVPKTKSWADLLGGYGIDTSDIPDTTADVPDGSDWFDDLSAAAQAAILGPGKYALYSSGDLSLDDLIGYDDDPLWGTSIYERPLKAVQ